MKNIFRFVLLLGWITLGIWLWTVFFPSPDKIIARQFAKIAQAASVQAGEGTIPRMLHAQTVGSYFATNVELDINVPHYQQHSTLTRDDLIQAIVAAKSNGGLTVKFPDINVTVAADKQNAQAEVTVQARAGSEQDIIQEMRFTLQKIDGKWLITRVQTIRPLS